MRNDPRNIMPGDRVLVFDSLLFENDIKTPLSHTVRPATVVARYGYHSFWRLNKFDLQKAMNGESTLYPGGYETWKYPDLVDVRFDHRPERISQGHFTDGVAMLRSEHAVLGV